jgi:hypothetical protein
MTQSILEDNLKQEKTMKKDHVLFATISILLFACSSLPQPSSTATVTPLPSNTPLPTATFTPMPTSDDSLHLFGTVWTMVHGQFQGVAGATVGISSCFPRSFDFHSESDGQGHFEVFVPSPELYCGITGIKVTMPGYVPQHFTENVADLRAIKSYDIVLVLEATATPH